MKKFGFVLAFVACMSFTLFPVLPAAAASSGSTPAESQRVLVQHAARGDLVIVSPEQMQSLAQSNPRLHSKLERANRAGTIPQLTQSERRIVNAMTVDNLDRMKAGWDPATGWIIVGVVAAILLVLLWQPLICANFPGALFCPPAVAVVAARN